MTSPSSQWNPVGVVTKGFENHRLDEFQISKSQLLGYIIRVTSHGHTQWDDQVAESKPNRIHGCRT